MPQPLSQTLITLSGRIFDVDLVAIAGQRFVDGVVHDLIYQMMQAARACGADVHTGAFAHGLQPFEHLYFTCSVFLRLLSSLCVVQNRTLHLFVLQKVSDGGRKPFPPRKTRVYFPAGVLSLLYFFRSLRSSA